MSNWTINDGELRRNVGMQTERYHELRRRSDEARLLELARGPRPSLLAHLRRWLEAVAPRAQQEGQYGSVELEHRRG